MAVYYMRLFDKPIFPSIWYFIYTMGVVQTRSSADSS